MAKNFLEQVVKDIKSLKIQGASRVRKQAVNALEWSIRYSKAKTVEQLKKELRKNSLKLVLARPTEPALRTAIRIILKEKNKPVTSLKELRENLLKTINEYESNREQAMKDIAEYGANKVPQNAVVFTHCHSNTVEEIILKAWRQKKVKEVICTETRPLFQGRITASTLSKAGIPVTMIVDSAANAFMKKADIFLTGADAILEDGSVVNKIGTSLISLAAFRENTPHYVASSTHKFDPVTYFGIEEEIEERNWKEVWEKKPGKLRIRNPAFDITPATHVTGIITEKGIFAPKNFSLEMYREFEIDKQKKELLSLIKLMKK